MKWKTAGVLAVTLVTGCSSVLGGGSRGRVREIQSDGASECKYLGVIVNTDRSGWSMADDQLGPMNEIRKRVSAMGGNAFVLTHGPSKRYAPVVQADAYRCP